MNTEQQAAINAEAERRYPTLPLDRYLQTGRKEVFVSANDQYDDYVTRMSGKRAAFQLACTFALSLIPEPTADMQADAELMFPASTGIPSELQNDYNEQTQRDRDNYLLGRTHQPQPSADMQADAEALYPYTNPKTPQNNAVVDRERAAYLKGCMRQRAEPDFLQAVTAERDSFCLSINSQVWNTEMRTAAESLLIMYDQMKQRLTPPTI